MIQLSYPEQLRRKQKKLTEALLAHRGLAGLRVEPIRPSPQRLGYRARVKLVVASDRDRIVTGLYVPGTHRVSDVSSCPVHPRAVNQLLCYMKETIARTRIAPYDQRTDRGQLRYVDIRYSTARQEMALTLVTRHKEFPEGGALARRLMRRFPRVSGVVQNINEDTGNVIWGERFRTLAGRDSLLERSGFLQLKYPAGVFSQVNPRVATKLYEHVVKVARLTGRETVVDAYCGVGPISLYLAAQSRLVWGMDENPMSIATAKQNARMNGVGNCRFFAGDVARTLEDTTQRPGGVDVMVVNPPRKGIRSALSAIRTLNPRRLIYVSCEPVTLARDLARLLESGYTINSVQPFDMFPQTEELETVASLTTRP